MRTPKFSTKRVLGVSLAAALAVGASLAVAGPSQATTTPTAKISPATGPSGVATQVVTITGKGFMSGTTSQVGVVGFDSAACSTYNAGTLSAAANPSVVSATKLTATVPSLALGSGTSNTYYACVFNSAHTLLGQAKYVVYAAPTVSALSVTNASDLGGTSIDITGTHFDNKATVTFDGIKATKVTYTSATAITAVAPAHAPSATAVPVVVSTEGGAASGSTTVTYVSAIKVVPATGNGAVAHTIDVTGAGFTATNTASVTLVGAATLTCGHIRLVSATELTCDVPAGADGAYTVTVADAASSPTVSTVTSSGATYTVADF